MKLFKHQKDRELMRSVAIAIIFGFVAGLAGYSVGNYFGFSVPYGGAYGFNYMPIVENELPELRFTKTIVATQHDVEVNNAIKKIEKSLVAFYPKKPTTGAVINQLYVPTELIGNGLIITTDGWMVTTQTIAQRLGSGMVAVYDGQPYEIQQVVIDEMSGAAFVKIVGTNLPVIVIGDSDEVVAGQQILLANSLSQPTINFVQNPDFYPALAAQEYVVSSERYATALQLALPTAEQYHGAPVFNISGEVVGIVTTSDDMTTTAMPINHVRSVVVDVLDDGNIQRPSVGIEYIDLARSEVALAQGASGALVYKQPVTQSPAYRAGIRVGDVIIKIENQDVTKATELVEIIQQYRPGDVLKFTVIRNTQTLEFSVTVGQQ